MFHCLPPHVQSAALFTVPSAAWDTTCVHPVSRSLSKTSSCVWRVAVSQWTLSHKIFTLSSAGWIWNTLRCWCCFVKLLWNSATLGRFSYHRGGVLNREEPRQVFLQPCSLTSHHHKEQIHSHIISLRLTFFPSASWKMCWIVARNNLWILIWSLGLAKLWAVFPWLQSEPPADREGKQIHMWLNLRLQSQETNGVETSSAKRGFQGLYCSKFSSLSVWELWELLSPLPPQWTGHAYHDTSDTNRVEIIQQEMRWDLSMHRVQTLSD